MSPFQLDDDDDAPPSRLGPGESFPELDDSELLDEDGPTDEAEFVDSSLVELRGPPGRRAPPPPAPAGRGAFVDDGEIALPPGLSQVVRSQSSRFPFRDLDDEDDGEFGGALTNLDDEPEEPEAPPEPAPPATTRSAQPAPPDLHRMTPGREEDDFGDLNEPSRRLAVAALRTEDDFGDLNERSRAIPAVAVRPAPPPAPPPADEFVEPDAPTRLRRVDSVAVMAALDRSGLAPALEVTLHDEPLDDAPLPPPPMAELADDEALPPLIATASAQSGVGFSLSEIDNSSSGSLRLDDDHVPARRFSAPAVSQDIHERPLLVDDDEPERPLVVDDDEPERPLVDDDEPAALDDDDDDGMSAPARLAPAPTEALGEPFPLDLWSDADELIGREVGQYRLVKPLSHGLTTRVYAAVDDQSGREVAIRVLGPTHSPQGRRARQFLYEAQQLAKLHHESIVEVLDTGATNDHLTYYVMEHLAGEPLAAIVRAEGMLTWQQVAGLTTQICEALIVAGDRNILATDLNLGSVVRLRDGDDDGRRRQPIKLLGVGVAPVASVFRSPDGNLVESKGTPPGAAEYMAPELASGGFPDATSAVYALGVMMYELLTGRPPFRGDSFLAVIKKQMYDEPTAPHLVVPQQEIPEPFEQVVLAALAKDPSRRFASVRDLHEAVLSARAREGELRRATAILALDPTDWDEDSARKSEPAQRRSEPQPLATFAADLRQRDPALAAAVLPTAADRARSAPIPLVRDPVQSEPRAIPIPILTPVSAPVAAAPPAARPIASGARPEPSMILSHLAPPLRAPEPVQLPAPRTAQIPIIVHAGPVANPASANFVRNVSGIIIGAVLVFFAISFLRKPAPAPARKDDSVAETRRTRDNPRTRKSSRETRSQAEEVAPIVVSAPSEPHVPAPVPEAIPEPAPPVAIPEAKTEPPPPVPVPEAKSEPVKTAVPTPTPKPKPATNRHLPARIEPVRLKSYFTAMEQRLVKRCASSPGAAGARVTVKITVDVHGNVKATALDKNKGTPLGKCAEDFVETSRFNETQHGGSRTHIFTF